MTMKKNISLDAYNNEDNELMTPLTAAEEEELLRSDVELSVENPMDDSLDDILQEAAESDFAEPVHEENQPMEEEPTPRIRSGRNTKTTGRRKTLNYGGETLKEKRIRTYRAFEAAKANNRIIEGIVQASKMEDVSNGYKDAIFEVVPVGEFAKNIENVVVYISGDNMTPVIRWNRLEKDKEKYIALKDLYRKHLLGARIQFCVENILVLNPDEEDVAERNYKVIGNRIMANEMLKDMYFDPDDADSIREGDIVNGIVLAALTRRILFHVGGIDLNIEHSKAPYITGVKRISETSSGKKLFQVNEEKDCLITRIVRNKETNQIVSLRTDFYEPLKGELIRKVDEMKVEGLHTGTVLRYLEVREDRPVRIVVKTDSGVEVLCDPPNWRVPPKEMDSVKVKITRISMDDKGQPIVRGHIKR